MIFLLILVQFHSLSIPVLVMVVPALYTVLAIRKQKKEKKGRGDQVADGQVEATV